MGCAITNSTSRFISFSVKCMWYYYRNGLQPFAAELPCHLHCTVLLYVAMPLQSDCHTQTSSTFLSVIHISKSSMTAALLPLVLYTSANLKSRVSFYSFTYRIFLSLISFGLQLCTAGHFSLLDPHVRHRSGSHTLSYC